MADANNPVQSPSNPVPWDQSLIFFALNDPVRRKLLLALASGGAKPANELNGGVSRTADTVLKHLSTLRSAGLVTMNPNPKDGRRSLYSLSPNVSITMTPTGRVLDFGFLTLRLDALGQGA